MRLRRNRRRPDQDQPAAAQPDLSDTDILAMLPSPDAPSWVTGDDLDEPPPMPNTPTGTPPAASPSASPSAPSSASPSVSAGAAPSPADRPAQPPNDQPRAKQDPTRPATTPPPAAPPRAHDRYPEDKLVARERPSPAADPAPTLADPGERPTPTAAPAAKPATPSAPEDPAAHRPSSTPAAQQHPGPVVRVLGPAHLTAPALADLPAGRAAALTELAAWLTLHPDADPARLADDLGYTTAAKTAASVSQLRKWLGADHNGDPYLPPKKQGEPYRFSRAVTSDLAHFQALAARGRALLTGDDPSAAIPILRRALTLVYGRVLTPAPPAAQTSPSGADSAASPPYPWARDTQRQITEQIVEITHLAATAAISTGQHATAEALLQRGLAAAPTDQRLLRDLLTAAYDAGTPHRQTQAADLVQQLLRHYDVTSEPETTAMIERLQRQPEQAAPKPDPAPSAADRPATTSPPSASQPRTPQTPAATPAPKPAPGPATAAPKPPTPPTPAPPARQRPQTAVTTPAPATATTEAPASPPPPSSPSTSPSPTPSAAKSGAANGNHRAAPSAPPPAAPTPPAASANPQIVHPELTAEELLTRKPTKGPNAPNRRPGRRVLIGATCAAALLALTALGLSLADQDPDQTAKPPQRTASTPPSAAQPSTSAPKLAPPQAAVDDKPERIDNESTDKRALTAEEIFPTPRAGMASRGFARDKVQTGNECRWAARGELANALGNCRQVVRATWVDDQHQIAMTIGVAALPTEQEAAAIANAGNPHDRTNWWRGMRGRDAEAIDEAAGVPVVATRGRYVIYAWVTHHNGQPPATDDPGLTEAGKAGIAYAQRAIDKRAK